MLIGAGSIVWLESPPLRDNLIALNDRPLRMQSVALLDEERVPQNTEPTDAAWLAQYSDVGFPLELSDEPFPVKPLLATLLGSLICAALLARYLSKPIRSLRAAIDAAAAGNLDLRIAPSMARNDELSQLGLEFDRMTAHLRTLMENRRRLFHDVSHELRSPLARLQIAVGLARQQPASIQESIARVEHEASRIDSLVGELLTLSKLDAGVIGDLTEEVDLHELVANIVDDARFEASEQPRVIDLIMDSMIDYKIESTVNSDIDSRADADDPPNVVPLMVKGQAYLLHRAIENVVRNALLHTHEHAAIQVIVDVFENRHAHIAVLDLGPGIPAAELETIFLPFYRGARPRSTGHGLGLSIARQVVDAHGGSIVATNRPAGGLCVEIFLPLNQ